MAYCDQLFGDIWMQGICLVEVRFGHVYFDCNGDGLDYFGCIIVDDVDVKDMRVIGFDD